MLPVSGLTSGGSTLTFADESVVKGDEFRHKASSEVSHLNHRQRKEIKVNKRRIRIKRNKKRCEKKLLIWKSNVKIILGRAEKKISDSN